MLEQAQTRLDTLVLVRRRHVVVAVAVLLAGKLPVILSDSCLFIRLRFMRAKGKHEPRRGPILPYCLAEPYLRSKLLDLLISDSASKSLL
jgi:hypothetical protein